MSMFLLEQKYAKQWAKRNKLDGSYGFKIDARPEFKHEE